MFTLSWAPWKYSAGPPHPQWDKQDPEKYQRRLLTKCSPQWRTFFMINSCPEQESFEIVTLHINLSKILPPILTSVTDCPLESVWSNCSQEPYFCLHKLYRMWLEFSLPAFRYSMVRTHLWYWKANGEVTHKLSAWTDHGTDTKRFNKTPPSTFTKDASWIFYVSATISYQYDLRVLNYVQW